MNYYFSKTCYNSVKKMLKEKNMTYTERVKKLRDV